MPRGTWRIWQSTAACRGYWQPQQRKESRRNCSLAGAVEQKASIWWNGNSGMDCVSRWTLEGFIHHWISEIDSISEQLKPLEQNPLSRPQIRDPGMALGTIPHPWVLGHDEVGHSFSHSSPLLPDTGGRGRRIGNKNLTHTPLVLDLPNLVNYVNIK